MTGREARGTEGFDRARAEAAMRELLHAIGQADDEQTMQTPARAAAAWAEAVSGYGTDPRSQLADAFPVDDPGLVVVAGIELRSTCAHHLLPVRGTATVAYRPDPAHGSVAGLSRLVRLLDGYARRLQLQERIGRQVVDALQTTLSPIGAACVITAEHGCMALEGDPPGAAVTTIATSGEWAGQAGHPDLAAVLAAHSGAPRRFAGGTSPSVPNGTAW